MATNPKGEPQAVNPKMDDLTTIVGINETLEQWFRESLKIQTYADLAALSVQKIRSRAKQAGFVLANEELELMLAQAKKRAEESSSSSPKSSHPTKTKSEAALALPEKTKEWNEFATFVVCFERKNVGGKEEKRTKIEHRTGIQHMETEEQASWPGIETDEACKWMLKRLGPRVTADDEEDSSVKATSTTKTAAISGPANIEITGIQVLQPPSTDRPQDLFAQNHSVSGYVKADVPFSLTISFQIFGPGAAAAARKNLEFGAVFHAINLLTHTPIRLGASQPGSLQKNIFSYTANLDPITLSAGTYQLKVLTTIQDAQTIWNHIEVPLFQVI